MTHEYFITWALSPASKVNPYSAALRNWEWDKEETGKDGQRQNEGESQIMSKRGSPVSSINGWMGKKWGVSYEELSTSFPNIYNPWKLSMFHSQISMEKKIDCEHAFILEYEA